MQIRTRLTLLFLGIAASILATVLVFVYVIYKQYTEDNFFNGLELKAAMTAQTAIRNTVQHPPERLIFPSPDGDTLPYTDNVSVYNNQYERIFSLNQEAVPVSPRFLEEAFQQGSTRFKHYNLDGLALVVEGPGRLPFVAVSEGFCDPSGLYRLRNILIVSFLAGLTLIALSGWYFAGKALEPVSDIMNEVDAIQPSAPEKRLSIRPGADELSRLSATFNRLLDRVEQAFRMQRMFLSNVSHELKNPLTVMRTQLEVALDRDRSAPDYRDALASLLEDVRNMGQVEEKLMQLARMYNDPDSIHRAPVRLDELLWNTREVLLRHHPAYKIRVEMHDLPEDENTLSIMANEVLLQTALQNLLDNACKYAPDHSARLVFYSQKQGKHRIEISNKGPGIPEKEIPLIFEPFYRSHRHRQIKGTGIGLALTHSILNWHRIQLDLQSIPHETTTFTLHFPSTE
jgi:signal transduction histidine kinase